MSFRGPLGAVQETGAFELGTRSADQRRVYPRAAQVGLAGLLVSGLILTMAAANTSSLLPESVRPIPPWLAGPFGSANLGLGVMPLLLVLSAMFASYAVVAHGAGRLSARGVLMCIAALHALVLLAPPLLSTDI